MDPITAAIVSGVVWFFLRSLVAFLIIVAGVGVGALVTAATDRPSAGIGVIVLGWLAAIAWEIFAIVQVIIAVVEVVELAS